MSLINISAELSDLNQRENKLFRSFCGKIPEANDDLNSLQRKKIAAFYEKYGRAYLGKTNYYGAERENLTVSAVFVEYTGQMVYNFGADYIIPNADRELAEMIVHWNTYGPSKLINSITNRIEELGRLNLLWS